MMMNQPSMTLMEIDTGRMLLLWQPKTCGVNRPRRRSSMRSNPVRVSSEIVSLETLNVEGNQRESDGLISVRFLGVFFLLSGLLLGNLDGERSSVHAYWMESEVAHASEYRI